MHSRSFFLFVAYVLFVKTSIVVGNDREDAKTLVQLRKYKEQPVQEAEAKKLAQSLGEDSLHGQISVLQIGGKLITFILLIRFYHSGVVYIMYINTPPPPGGRISAYVICGVYENGEEKKEENM
jgi:hypothetical protein